MSLNCYLFNHILCSSVYSMVGEFLWLEASPVTGEGNATPRQCLLAALFCRVRCLILCAILLLNLPQLLLQVAGFSDLKLLTRHRLSHFRTHDRLGGGLDSTPLLSREPDPPAISRTNGSIDTRETRLKAFYEFFPKRT